MTPEMRKNKKTGFSTERAYLFSLETNLKNKLVLILAKKETQSLISISTILKFSAEVYHLRTYH